MKKLTTLFIAVFALANQSFLFAQAPGATCATAAPINGTGNIPGCTGAQIITNFTASGSAPAISCIGAGVFRRDGYYSFVALGGMAVTVSATSTTAATDLIIQVISGTCGAEVEIGCANNITVSSAQTEAVSLGVLAAGTYYIRIINTGAAVNMNVSNVCVDTTPANDNCAGAIALTPLTSTCVAGANQLTGDVSGATQSLPGCTGNANDDVWYSFTTNATANQPYVITVAGSTSFDAVFEVFSTSCMGTSISCVNVNGMGGSETITLTGLIANTQYWIRVYDAGAGIPATTTFTICITAPTSAVAAAIPTSATCNGICDGSAVGSVVGGVGPFAYDWTGPSSYTGTGQNIASLCVGTYTLTVTDSSNMTTSTATGVVGSNLVGTFSYAGSPYCQIGTALPTYSGGGVSGTFSSTPGLVIDAVTGVVDLASSVPGCYIVTNTIAATGGCAAVTSTAVICINPPASGLSITGPNPLPCGMSCYTLSVASFGTGITYVWTTATPGASIVSGQGTTSVTICMPLTGAGGGVYAQTVTAFGPGVCPSAISDTMYLTINALPVNFNLLPDSTNAMNYNTFNATPGTGLTYSWDFGDGTAFSTLASPSHIYASAGIYSVCLSATDGTCSGGMCQTLIVSGVLNSCNALFNIAHDTASANPNGYTVTNLSYGSNLTYLWDFGDTTTSTLQHPTHTYANIGPYQLCLTIDDGAGCNQTYCDSLFAVDSLHTHLTPISITVVGNPGQGTTVGVNEWTMDNGEWIISPNPTTGVFQILNYKSKIISAKVMNVLGEVLNEKWTMDNGQWKADLSSFAKGIYFVEIQTTDKSRITKKLVIE